MALTYPTFVGRPGEARRPSGAVSFGHGQPTSVKAALKGRLNGIGTAHKLMGATLTRQPLPPSPERRECRSSYVSRNEGADLSPRVGPRSSPPALRRPQASLKMCVNYGENDDRPLATGRRAFSYRCVWPLHPFDKPPSFRLIWLDSASTIYLCYTTNQRTNRGLRYYRCLGLRS